MEQGPSLRCMPQSIDDQIRQAYGRPCPSTYNLRRPEISGGRISEARLPSAVDHGANRNFVPGPGSYQTAESRDFSLPEGGRLNRMPPQEKLKLDEDWPAPGTYGVPIDPTLPRQLYGSFGKDPRVSKFIQDEVMRSKMVPAPGEHEVMDAMENLRPFCPEGGRYMEQGKGHSYFDSAAKLAEGKPAPDRYNLPGGIRPNKAAGKLVWKYRSETIEATKKLITKVVGDAHDNPAPGHYTLPDPAPIAPVITMKGRETGPALPHPFAYNCAPDHARKYDTYVPVREQSSADHIFGRDFKRGALSKQDRAARARALADEVAELPPPLAQHIEEPGESMKWKAGGFKSLQRAQSAPGMQRAREHPAVEETRGHYPALSRFHGRKDKTFAPMAVKRPETVNTHRRSNAYQSLQRKKWEIGAIAAALEATTSGVMETLNEQALREDATCGLMDKAKFRMRMEGLSKEQQDLVLSEFPVVVQETAAPGCLLDPSMPFSAVTSLRDPLAEPFVEPMVRVARASSKGSSKAERLSPGELVAEPIMSRQDVAEPLAEPSWTDADAGGPK